MRREGARGFSYLPAEGGEGVQALFVLGGVALLGVVPAAALREHRQGESQRVPVLPAPIPPVQGVYGHPPQGQSPPAPSAAPLEDVSPKGWSGAAQS